MLAENKNADSYSINLRQLKTEMKKLKSAIFWSSSHYWTTREPGVKRKKTNTGVKIVYLKKFTWYAFVFSKFHRESLLVFQGLPTYDAYFYKEIVAQANKFAGWCIDGKHFEDAVNQLRAMSGIEIEFVVLDSAGAPLAIPPLFEAMGLKFYERLQGIQTKWTSPQTTIPQHDTKDPEYRACPLCPGIMSGCSQK